MPGGRVNQTGLITIRHDRVLSKGTFIQLTLLSLDINI